MSDSSFLTALKWVALVTALVTITLIFLEAIERDDARKSLPVFTLGIKPPSAISQCFKLTTEDMMCRISVLLDLDGEDPLEEQDMCYMVIHDSKSTVDVPCSVYELVKKKGVP